MCRLLARIDELFLRAEEPDAEAIVLSNRRLRQAAIEASERARKEALTDEDVAIFLKCR